MFFQSLRLFLLIQFIRGIIVSILILAYFDNKQAFWFFYYLLYTSFEYFFLYALVYIPYIYCLNYFIRRFAQNVEIVVFLGVITTLISTLIVSYFFLDDFHYYFTVEDWHNVDLRREIFFSVFRTPGFILSYTFYPSLYYFFIIRKGQDVQNS